MSFAIYPLKIIANEFILKIAPKATEREINHIISFLDFMCLDLHLVKLLIVNDEL